MWCLRHRLRQFLPLYQCRRSQWQLLRLRLQLRQLQRLQRPLLHLQSGQLHSLRLVRLQLRQPLLLSRLLPGLPLRVPG
ncbi:MAG: hypothetical protein ABWK15_01685 [Dissulfuribacterales bacterium]